MCHQEYKTHSGILSVESNEALAKINKFGIYVKEHILTSLGSEEAKLRGFLEKLPKKYFRGRDLKAQYRNGEILTTETKINT